MNGIHTFKKVNDMRNRYRQLFVFILLGFVGICLAQTQKSVIDLIRLGENEAAKRDIVKLQRTGKDQDAYLFMHGLASTSGDSSVYYYQKLIDTYPNSNYADDAKFRIAQMNYAKGLYLTAKSEFLRIIDLRPDSPLHADCLYWTALCCQSLDKQDSSQFYFNEVIRKFSNSNSANRVREMFDLSSGQNIAASTSQNNASTSSETQPSTTMFAVQVGAFGHQSNALLRKSFFEKKGYPVALRTKLKDDNTLYLVWVGDCDSRSEAKKLGDQLNKSYGISYALVSESR